MRTLKVFLSVEDVSTLKLFSECNTMSNMIIHEAKKSGNGMEEHKNSVSYRRVQQVW